MSAAAMSMSAPAMSAPAMSAAPSSPLGLSLLLLAILAQVNSQACPGPAIGPAVGNRAEDTTTMADVQYIMLTKGVVTCHGEIDQWQYWLSNINGARCTDLLFQVWRPVGGAMYKLVGEKLHQTNCPGTGSMAVTIPAGGRIPVQPNDVLGWLDVLPILPTYSERDIEYDFAMTGSAQYGQVLIHSGANSCPTLAADCDWLDDRFGGNARFTVRDYSLRATTAVLPSPPIISNLPATVKVDEDQTPPVFVYKVQTFNTFTYEKVVPPDVTYSLPGAGGTPCNPADYQIDADGVVTATVLLNAAGPCNLRVTVTQGPMSDTKTLTIDVEQVPQPLDINNLPDTVTKDSRTTPDNNPVIIVTGGDTYTIKYTEPYGAPVTINAATGLIETSQDYYNWQGPLHYDIYVTTENTYYEDGPEQLSLVITNIRVPPVIDNLEAVITIPENTLTGTTIFTVAASSADARSTPLTFSRPYIYPKDASGAPTYVFNINAASGVVTTNAAFDYFGTRRYFIEVLVEDGDLMFQSSPKNLTVELTWVNEAPVFASPGGFTATVDELEPIGAVIPGLTLDGTDRDVPVGDWFDYIVNDNPGPGSYLFTADNMTHKVQMAGVVALAPGVASQTYNLEVVAIDSFGLLNPARPVTLDITVVDINDHAPVFNPLSYTGSITESSPGGTATGVTVAATDDDAGSNAAVTFSLLEYTATLYFQIDPSTGVVTSTQPISYVDFRNLTFTVIASDAGVPPLTGTAQVFIEVLEINTHRPEFPTRFYNVEIPFSTPVGHTAVTIHADDLDTSAVNNFTYYYLTIQYDFGILQNTGNITVAKNLGSFTKYLLHTNARDNSSPELKSMYPCTVRIDTYDAGSTLVDISLFMTLDDFMASKDRYMQELNTLLDPWVVKLESAHLREDKTVVTLYAFASDSGLGTNLEESKYFVHRNDLLGKLRTNMYGEPREELRGPEFAEWQPYEVQPTHPVWLVDTPGGIAVLTLLCLLAAAAIALPVACLVKKKGGTLCKNRPKTPRRAVSPSDNEEFNLQYQPTKEKPNTYHGSPLVPAAYPGLPVVEPGNSKPNSMPPVLQPERLPPKPRGGVAA